MRISKKALSLLMLSMAISSLSGNANAEGQVLNRINGSDRYETALSLSKELYQNSKNIILASGENFADALSGGQLSSALDAPILLTKRNSINKNTIDEMNRLNPEKIYILGGKGTISENVLESIRKNTDAKIERVSGQNRFETAIKIAELSRKNGKAKDTLIANGYSFPDALSGSGIVANSNKSMVLTDGNKLQNIEMGEKTILGGKNTVSEKIKGERIAGKDRYETSLQIAKKLYPNPKNVILVSGENYPDALSAVSLSKKDKAPVVLVKRYGMSDDVKKYVENADKITVVGGESTVSDLVLYKIAPNKTITINKSSGGRTIIEKKVLSPENIDSSIKEKISEGFVTVYYDDGGDRIQSYIFKKGSKLNKTLNKMQEFGGDVKKGYYGRYSVDGKDIDLDTYTVEKDIIVKKNWHKVDDDFIKDLKVPKGEYKVVFKWEDGTKNVAITKGKEVVDLYAIGVCRELPEKENQERQYYVNGKKYEYDKKMQGGPLYFKVDKDSVIEVKMEDIENSSDADKDKIVDFIYYDDKFMHDGYYYYSRVAKKDILEKVEELEEHIKYKKGTKINFPGNIETEYFKQDGWRNKDNKKVSGEELVEDEGNTYTANLKEKIQNVEVKYIFVGKDGEKVLNKTNMTVGKVDPLDEILTKSHSWRRKNKEIFEIKGEEEYSSRINKYIEANSICLKVDGKYKVDNYRWEENTDKEEKHIEKDKLNAEIRKNGKIDIYFLENYKDNGYYYNSIGMILGNDSSGLINKGNLVVPSNINGVDIKKISSMEIRTNGHEKLNKLIFEEGIETIESSAFNKGNYDNEPFEEVILPDSLAEIEDGGLAGLCMKTVKFGNGELKIGSGAFGITGLKGVIYIPENVQYIGGYAFSETDVEKLIVTDDSRYDIDWNRKDSRWHRYIPVEYKK